MRLPFAVVLLSALCCVTSSNAVSEEAHIHQITTKIKEWANTQLAIRYPSAKEISIAVKLPRSVTALPLCLTNFELNTKSIDVGRTRVGVTCQTPAWSTRGTVNASVVAQVLVTNMPLKKGHRLVAEDYRVANIELTTPKNPYYLDGHIVGKKLKRSLRSGELITYKHIDHDYAVHKGDAITLTFTSDTFSLSTSGIALENGVIGDRIKVRNKDSGKVLRGTVTGKQAVDIH